MLPSFLEKKRIKEIESDIIELYSLLHQRYVISEGGLDAMVGDKSDNSIQFCYNSYIEAKVFTWSLRSLSSLFVSRMPSSTCMPCYQFLWVDWIIEWIKVCHIAGDFHFNRQYSLKLYCPCCKEIYLPQDEESECIIHFNIPYHIIYSNRWMLFRRFIPDGVFSSLPRVCSYISSRGIQTSSIWICN